MDEMSNKWMAVPGFEPLGCPILGKFHNAYVLTSFLKKIFDLGS